MSASLCPVVSIVIPARNRAWSLREAVDSVLDQSFREFELIVVDDGSTDDTAALLREYGGRLRVIAQPHRGVSAARNRGLLAARGSLLALLDSDDCWLPGKLAAQVAFFEDHPEALICQTEEIWIRNGVRVNPGRRHRKPSGRIFEPSLKLCLVSPSAVMFRRKLLDRVGLFDPSLPACEDYDLWLRVSCRYPVHLIAKPLIVKRGGHADQLSRMPGLDSYRIRALEKILASGRLTDRQYRAAARVLVEKCRIYAGGCAKRGRGAEARRYRELAQHYRA